VNVIESRMAEVLRAHSLCVGTFRTWCLCGVRFRHRGSIGAEHSEHVALALSAELALTTEFGAAQEPDGGFRRYVRYVSGWRVAAP
jgi:hypothetical protein